MRSLDPADLAGVDANGMPCLAHRKRYDIVALQGGKMHGLAGRPIDGLEVRLCAARKINLQAGMAEIDDAGSERIQPASRHLRRKAALDERRQQVVACRNIETGPV